MACPKSITDDPKSTSPLEELYCSRLLFILSLMTWTHPDSSHLIVCWGCSTKKCKTSRMLGHTSIIYPSKVYYIYLIHIGISTHLNLYVGIICMILHIISTFSMLRMVTWICWWPTTESPMAPSSPTLSVAAKWKQPSLHAMCWRLASHHRKWKQEMLHQVGVTKTKFWFLCFDWVGFWLG